MNRLFILLILKLFCIAPINAQLISNDVGLSLRTTGSKIDLNRFPDVKGSPYLNDAWQNGSILIEKVNKIEIKKIKFNCFQNQIEYEEDGKVYTPLKRYTEFIINDLDENNNSKKRIFRNEFISDQEFKTYFEVLFDGETKLLQKYAVRIEEYAEPLSLHKIKRFNKIPQLYIYKSKNQSLIKIKKDKKTILNTFDNKSEQIAKYISSNDLNMKNE
jgi:hypothetical protein